MKYNNSTNMNGFMRLSSLEPRKNSSAVFIGRFDWRHPVRGQKRRE